MALGMAKSAVKGMFLRPATLMYPKMPAKKFSGTRGHLENDISRCIFCGACQRKCPCVAIQVDRAERKWELDVFRCVSCSCCVEACPVKCLRMEKEYTQPTTEHAMKVVMKKELPAATPAPVQTARPAAAIRHRPRPAKPAGKNAHTRSSKGKKKK